MKKSILICLMLLIAVMLSARIVTNEEAQLVAESKILIEEKKHVIENHNDIIAENQLIARVFHLDPEGFIIVSADTDIVPVYGYSFKNDFRMNEADNPGLKMLKADIPLRMLAREATPEIVNSNNDYWQTFLNGDYHEFICRDRSVYPPSTYNSPTGGWLATQWDQGYPFNQFCPTDPDVGGRSVVGCVATAFAQVINYHREIGDLEFSDDDDYVSDSYTSPVYIDDDHDTYNFLSFPELNPLIDDVRDAYANGLNFSNELKGALSFACGILTEMQYSNSGSGTQTLFTGYAFMNRLGYDSAQNVYNISSTFYNTLADDMVNGRPVLISILGGPEGHCIVVDGWNSDSDYYHLNMGWSGYDDGWYSLPEGMPSGYNVIQEAVVNIEGGTVPVDILGFVNAGGIDVSGTVVELDGAVDYVCETDASGMFELVFVHEGFYDLRATLELPDGGYYYKEDQVYIDNTNTFIQIDMENYEFITGDVTASTSVEGTHLAVYDGLDIVSSGIVNSDGSYQIPGLLPGYYVLVASNGESFGRVLHFSVDFEHQNFDFELFNYDESATFTHSTEPVDTWSLIATTMSIGMKLTADEIAGMEQALISKVKFKSPIDPADGALWAQVWQEENLISEMEITDFSFGEELEITFDDFALVDENCEYYVGYKIQSSNAVLAWHDEGPRVSGKGAWFRINSWTEVNPTNDFNFNIESVVLEPIMADDENVIHQVTANLTQNYPNPFNPVTQIDFQISETQNASLVIFNLKGQKVKTLASGIINAGDHSVIWQGRDDNDNEVASGIYYYQLKTENSIESRKMILLK